MNDRTAKMDEMKAKHKGWISQIQAYLDHTREAKDRIVREETVKYNEAIRVEEERVTTELNAEVERAYKAAHGPARTLDAAGELRLARLREEIKDELDTKRLDPIRGYEDAVRAGDRERAQVIGRVGARYVEGARRQRLGELVEANLPEAEKSAREKLAALERERDDLTLGLAMQQMARGA